MRSIRISLLAFALLGACSTDDKGSGLVDRGVCDTLIECASDLAPESRDEFVATYGEGGTCWSGGPNQWAACRDACRDSLDALNMIGQITGQTCGTCESDADCPGMGASCDAGVCVGGDSGEEMSEGETGDTDTPGCEANYEAPEECLRFVSCVGALTPEQHEEVEAEYGENGSCWCGTEDEAADCYAVCLSQLETAIENSPTTRECHESYCTIDELDPTQPYGPVVDGACPNWNGMPQLPLVEPLDLPGSVCAPPCSGIAMSCPEHPQSSADGTCYLATANGNYCVNRCWVDPTFLGGTQCHCGAICQPHGGPDGEGNLRGICTFE